MEVEERNALKITFDNYQRPDINHAKENNIARNAESNAISAGYILSPGLNESTEYESKYNGNSAIADEAIAGSLANDKDRMVVLSHTLSEDEFKKYCEDKDLSDVDMSDAVTILDHIKMELIKAGQEITGFTDDLAPELKKEIEQTVSKASELNEMTDAMKRYFVSTGREITIDNLYLAKFSVGSEENERSSTYFAGEAPGYLMKKASFEDIDKIKAQAEQLLINEGLSAKENETNSEKLVNQAVWLVKNSLTVDATHLKNLENIESVTLPLSPEKLDKVIDIALSEKAAPGEVSLLRDENIYEEAVRITDEILAMSDSEIHATKVMEEVRLKMTFEANLKLIESGFSIDTKNLEAYVEALREVEATTAYRESREIAQVQETIEDIKNAPSFLIGKVLPFIEDADLSTLRKEGNELKNTLDKANIEYEKMFTEVRKDLGDSIKKAFRNVDELLKENGFEITESNKRAVRILGYNSMEINKENLESVKVLDEKLSKVLKSITPADTLNLIRKGTSPVNMTVEELNSYLEEKENTEQARMEKYSRFLYKLEKAEAINSDERQQYIDVYRLLNQLEKTEYAAIGALVKTGKELSFANLKEQIKTTNHIGMDISVDESFGLLVSGLEKDLDPVKMKALNISENTTLEQAYDAMNLEISEAKAIEEEYVHEKYSEFKEGLKASAETVEELILHGEPVSITNINSMELLWQKKNSAFKKVEDVRGEEFREEIETLKEEFDEEESAKEGYEDLITNSKEAIFNEAMSSDSYLDVKSLMLTHKQLSLSLSLSKNETYNMPCVIDGEMTDVVLKIVHNEKDEPNVTVSFENERLGSVMAKFTVNKAEASGYIACSLKETVTKMKKAADILGEGVKVVHSKDTDSQFGKISMKDNSDNVSNIELYRIAKTFLKGIGETNED